MMNTARPVLSPSSDDAFRFRQGAFTLVELLVVIAIITILAAMLLPALGESIRVSHAIACQNTQRQLYLSLTAYNSDYRQLPGKPVNWQGAPPSSSYNDLCRYKFYDNHETMGWSGLREAGYAELDLLLGCPAEEGLNRRETSTWQRYGSLEDPTPERFYVHYGYRYNAAVMDAAWGRALLKSMHSGRPLILQGLDAGYAAVDARPANGLLRPQVLIFEDPAYGLNFGGDGSMEAAAMIPNPANWPHVRGGNLIRMDGSGKFLENRRKTPPDQGIGWPITRYGPLGTAEYNKWNNLCHTASFLDYLLSQ